MANNSSHNDLYAKLDNRERQVIAHQVYQDNFRQNFQKILDDYGLAARLEMTKTSFNLKKEPGQNPFLPRTRIKILDAGCGLGLYLYDVAEMIESQHLRELELEEAVSFYGVDLDEVMIEVATDFAHSAKPPRPYFDFFIHDLTQPLEECPGLFLDKQYQFDYIFSLGVFEYIPNARVHLERLYQALAPGGVLYLRGILPKKGPDAWIDPHPAMAPFSQAFFQSLLEVNGGVVVSTEQGGWLEEAGAIRVQTLRDVLVTGGPTRKGTNFLRNFSQIAHSMGSYMVQKGLVTHKQLTELTETLFREFRPEMTGQMVLLNTIAQKPPV